jgi:hypothetical protein
MFRLRTIILLWLARRAWRIAHYWWQRRRASASLSRV